MLLCTTIILLPQCSPPPPTQNAIWNPDCISSPSYVIQAPEASVALSGEYNWSTPRLPTAITCTSTSLVPRRLERGYVSTCSILCFSSSNIWLLSNIQQNISNLTSAHMISYYGVMLCCREGELLGWASRLLELHEWGSRENQDTWGHHQKSPSATSGEEGKGWNDGEMVESPHLGIPSCERAPTPTFGLISAQGKSFLRLPLHFFFVQKCFVYRITWSLAKNVAICSPAVQVCADNRTVYFEPWINAKQAHAEWLPGVWLRHSVPPVQYTLWLSSGCSSMLRTWSCNWQFLPFLQFSDCFDHLFQLEQCCGNPEQLECERLANESWMVV